CAITAWSASTTSMITPPLSISARPVLTRSVPTSAIGSIVDRALPLRRAPGVAGHQRVELRVDPRVRGGVVRGEAVAFPRDVGRDAGPDHRHAEAFPGRGRARVCARVARPGSL